MASDDGDDVITRLVGAAVGDAEPSEKAALVERLFALLPAQNQERLLRDVLDRLESAGEPVKPLEQTPDSPRVRIPLMGNPVAAFPFGTSVPGRCAAA